MKNSKLKIGIINAAIAVGFFLVGSFVGWPNQSSLLLGDIGKAKKSNTTVVKIDRDAMQEKMLNDKAYCQKMLATVGMMQLHAKQFGALLVMTDAVAKNEKALQSSLEEMQKVTETVKNATAAIDLFADDMVRLSKGDKVKGFEQDYNNAMLGFSMLQRCSNVAVDFAQNVRDSLNLLAEANKKDIETMYSEWVSFAYVDALMSQDQLRCHNVEQLFFRNSEDQLGNFPIFALLAQQEQLGVIIGGKRYYNQEQLDAMIVLCDEQLEIKESLRSEQLEIVNRIRNEQLEAAFANLYVMNSEQLNTIIVAASHLNDNLMLSVLPYVKNNNNLGVVAVIATDFKCVDMLNLVAGQVGLRGLIIGDNDILGALIRS